MERSERLSVPMVCATATFSAIFGVTSMVTVRNARTTVWPSTISCVVDWSVASTRRLRRIVSDALSDWPSSPLTVCVSTRSTRSPGNTKPATPVWAETGTVTARMPGPSAAARKPLSPGFTSEPCVTGSPAVIGRRTTVPSSLEMSASPSMK